jgi:hypothetical protein
MRIVQKFGPRAYWLAMAVETSRIPNLNRRLKEIKEDLLYRKFLIYYISTVDSKNY